MDPHSKFSHGISFLTKEMLSHFYKCFTKGQSQAASALGLKKKPPGYFPTPHPVHSTTDIFVCFRSRSKITQKPYQTERLVESSPSIRLLIKLLGKLARKKTVKFQRGHAKKRAASLRLHSAAVTITPRGFTLSRTPDIKTEKRALLFIRQSCNPC